MINLTVLVTFLMFTVTSKLSSPYNRVLRVKGAMCPIAFWSVTLGLLYRGHSSKKWNSSLFINIHEQAEESMLLLITDVHLNHYIAFQFLSSLFAPSLSLHKKGLSLVFVAVHIKVSFKKLIICNSSSVFIQIVPKWKSKGLKSWRQINFSS